MKKIFLKILVVLIFLPSCINEPVLEQNTKKGNFESLWKIIDTKYCYLDYKKINWDSIHTTYAARVDTVSNEFIFFNLLGDMLKELKDGHVNLYSNFNRSRYWNWFTDYPDNFSSDIVYNDNYLGDNYLIAGGLRYQIVANGEVGYVYYNSFSDYFSDSNFSYIVKYFSNCKGIIIDVRNNGGGFLSLDEQLASYFFKEKKVTGYINHKTGNGHSEFSKPVEMVTPASKSIQWQRPVIVLVNRMSYSATNSFVNRMKQATNAIVIGDKSGGGGGLPLSSEIPNGWMVRLSASPMYDSEMKNTEWGIDPDVKLDMDTADMAKGYDTIIEKAISLILPK